MFAKRLISLILAAGLIVGCSKKEFIFVMGNSDVPVGMYTKEMFEYLGVDEQAASKHITYAGSAKEVITAISEGTADCGVVYATDAVFAGLRIVSEADKNMCSQIVYPAAVLKNSKNKTAAEHFLIFLQSEEAQKVFSEIGFTFLSSYKQSIAAAEDKGEIVVFAAASLTEALNSLAERYKIIAPNVKLVFNFDSSGTLKRQIEMGAECDVFISAAKKTMDQLDINVDENRNPDRLDYIDSANRIDLLENKAVLCVNEDSEYKICSFQELAEYLK